MEAVAEKRKLSDLTYDQLALARVAIDAKIKEQEAVVGGLKDKRDKLNLEFMRRFNEQGVQNVKTKHGTPYILHRTSCTIADRDSFGNWLAATDNWRVFLDWRVSKTAVASFKEASEGALPPGLNWSVVADIGFKK